MIADLHRHGPVLFVAMATGQNVANLPPILEMAEAGDRVLWLESAQARRLGYAEGSRTVLRERQIACVDPVLAPDAPAEFARAAQAALRSYPDLRPVFVHNGGTKLSSLALEHALADGARPILYGQEQPAELWVMPNGIGGELRRRRYRRAGLRLGEILACREYAMQGPATGGRSKDARRIWPDAWAPAEQDYGLSPERTAAEHTVHFAWDKAKREAEAGFASFTTTLETMPGRAGRWIRNAVNRGMTAHRRTASSVAAPPAEFSGIGSAGNILDGVFDGALRLSQDAHRIAQARAKARQPSSDLGALFERAVLRRLRQWLTTHGPDCGVVEAWHNVTAIRPGTGEVAAQWDIVLVLGNAVVVSLECKSFEVKNKDMDARLLNLQRAATQLGRMVLCMPVYTQFSDTPWFRETMDKIDRLMATRQEWLPFTLPDQFTEYLRVLPDGTQQSARCDTFEDALTQALARYRTIASD
jgi:hypothetical protein